VSTQANCAEVQLTCKRQDQIWFEVQSTITMLQRVAGDRYFNTCLYQFLELKQYMLGLLKCKPCFIHS